MEPQFVPEAVEALAARWWVLILRGVAAIAFGILLIAVPMRALFALVMVWGAYAAVDGLLSLFLAAKRGRAGHRWGWMFVEGLAGIAAAVLAFAWPRLTALVLLSVIAIWAVITGVAELATAMRIRRHMRSEWLLVCAAVLSIAFGVMLLWSPVVGAMALVKMIGVYGLIFGLLFIGLGIELHHWYGVTRHRQFPSGGMPTPA
jgi:uncharacterized membrane protein HdeD (DUF308 family)